MGQIRYINKYIRGSLRKPVRQPARRAMTSLLLSPRQAGDLRLGGGVLRGGLFGGSPHWRGNIEINGLGRSPWGASAVAIGITR